VGRKEVVGSEAFQHLVNVARHRESHSGGGEFDIHSKVRIAFIFVFDGEFISVAPKCLNEVISIVAGAILDVETVNIEAKLKVAIDVTGLNVSEFA
jgi:hypothetical protein